MEGQKTGAARLPEKAAVRVPKGTRDAIERAAERVRMTPAEWHRRALRRALEHAPARGREKEGGTT